MSVNCYNEGGGSLLSRERGAKGSKLEETLFLGYNDDGVVWTEI